MKVTRSAFAVIGGLTVMGLGFGSWGVAAEGYGACPAYDFLVLCTFGFVLFGAGVTGLFSGLEGLVGR